MNPIDIKQVPKTSSFIKNLFEIVETPAFQKIICWNEDGKSVKIWSFKELEAKVLSLTFRHRSYHSFIRQLNMYGFKKQYRTPSNKSCSFLHPLFERGGEEKLPLIKPSSLKKRASIEELTPLNPSQTEKKSVEIAEGKRRIAEVYASFSQFRIAKRVKVNNKVKQVQPEEIDFKRQQINGINLPKKDIVQFYKELKDNFTMKNLTDDNSKLQRTIPLLKIEAFDKENDKGQFQMLSSINSMKGSQKQHCSEYFDPNLKETELKFTSAGSEIYQKLTQQNLHRKNGSFQLFVDFPKKSIFCLTQNHEELTTSIDLLNFKASTFTPQPYYYSTNYMPTYMPSYTPYVQIVPQQIFTQMPQLCYQPVYFNSMI